MLQLQHLLQLQLRNQTKISLRRLFAAFGEMDKNARIVSKAAGCNYYAVQQIVNDRLAPACRDTAEYYIVKSGDTFWGIAQKYGTTYQEIARLSGISNPNLIFPGQKVRVK